MDETRPTTVEHRQGDLPGFLSRVPVIPVLTVENVESAIPLARALVAGGLPVLEITLRTEAGLAAIKAIAREIAGAVVGAGTVLTGDDYRAAAGAGARFAVSPGASPALFDAAERASVPLLPGAATASEVMVAAARGYRVLKFFPAEPLGGVATLKALAGPFPDIRYCPTGGINALNARDYLALGSVICVGGSWVAPEDAVVAGDWQRITGLAKSAAALSNGSASR